MQGSYTPVGGKPGGGYQRYVDQMFNWSTASTALTQMNQGTSSSAAPYAPLADGELIGIQLQISGQAATSLAQSGYITLTCTMWAPINTLTIPFTGFGLLTAPQLIGGNLESYTWDDLRLPVRTAIGIVGKVLFAYSPVTPNIQVAGRFNTTAMTAAK